MPSATLNGTVIAETTRPESVEGNVYFPPEDIKKAHFKPAASGLTTVCGWKGTASYYDVEVDGEVKKDAAWYYPEPKSGAANIKNYVAFYKSKIAVSN